MRKSLVKTLYFENGELHAVINGNRTLLANCKPIIEIYEEAYRISTIGSGGYGYKKNRITIALCNEMEFTRNDIGVELLRRISSFDLFADVQRKDGIFENLAFYNIIPDELIDGGTWSFEVPQDSEIARKLLSI
jgi:hypothetical protein